MHGSIIDGGENPHNSIIKVTVLHTTYFTTYCTKLPFFFFLFGLYYHLCSANLSLYIYIYICFVLVAHINRSQAPELCYGGGGCRGKKKRVPWDMMMMSAVLRTVWASSSSHHD